MIVFLQKTWFLWWILASILILRWFHLFSSSTHERALEAIDSAKEQSSSDSKRMPSGSASSLFT